jgi:prevent-host-death family protein
MYMLPFSGAEMSPKTVAATQFKAECLRLTDEMSRDRQPVTITKRGRAVAVLAPMDAAPPGAIIGALRGSVQRFDDPFDPVLGPEDWNAQA